MHGRFHTIPFILVISLLLLAGCTPQTPDHLDFANIQSRSELLSEFGEPEAIQANSPMLDVTSLNDPASVFDTAEQWTYSSTRNGSQGKTIFFFLSNKQTGLELMTGQNWLSNSAYAIRLQSEE